jgi:hypothetical protein
MAGLLLEFTLAKAGAGVTRFFLFEVVIEGEIHGREG